MKKYLEVGKIVSTHGINGEVRVLPWADSPQFLTKFKLLYFKDGAEEKKVLSSRVHKTLVLIKFEGVEDVRAADELRDSVVYIDRDDVNLPEGSYFIQDLIGLEVQDNDSGELYGEITDVIQNRANDVYCMRHKNGKEYLIPVIDDVVKRTDLEEKKVYIFKMKGLFDDED
ncbi:MAG: ribosome maturation factor RimM [Oscillospiraceae bacterium]|jgi:16S rRNA processing protein RimM|nr:ribosome maturation factor RimM [Oscillospiraceae bacterium]